MTLPLPTPNQIKAQVDAVLEREPEARCIAIRSPEAGSWPEIVSVRGRAFRLKWCDSPLSVRQCLTEDQRGPDIRDGNAAPSYGDGVSPPRRANRDCGLGRRSLPGNRRRLVLCLEQDVLADGTVDPADSAQLLARTEGLMEAGLTPVTKVAPAFSATLRAYRRALLAEDHALADGLLAWLSGQPNVAVQVRRAAGLKGDIDHFGAANLLTGLLIVLRDSGYSGLLVTLDEVETLQRIRADTREKGLNALRQWIDEIDAGRFPGLYLLITGTPAFYDGPQGAQRLPPLAQRLDVDFTTEVRFDNPRAVQIRLPGFDIELLSNVGRKVRDIYAEGCIAPVRVTEVVHDEYVRTLATAVTGNLGGRTGVAPRLFLKKLVADVLDRGDQFPDFDPRKHYTLTISSSEMTPQERVAIGTDSVDDIEL